MSTVDDPQMPNGDCDCGSIPFRHLDANGHVPACANWTWPMLWQERLAHNLAIVAGLGQSFWLGQCREEPFPDNDGSWFPGCGRAHDDGSLALPTGER